MEMVDAAFLAFLEKTSAYLAQLNPEETETLRIVLYACHRAGIEQQAVADKIESNQSTVSRWYAGLYPLPSKRLDVGVRVNALRKLFKDHIQRVRVGKAFKPILNRC